MATVNKAEVAKLVARCRRIGWPVEVGSGSADYHYRITRPDGYLVSIHRTPSDPRWMTWVLRDLDKDGEFTRAEEEAIARDKEERAAKLKADREKAEAKAAREAASRAARDDAVTRAAGPFAIREVDIDWMLTPAGMPETRTVIVTPEAARKALETVNTANRKKRDRRTDEFVRMIRDNEFGCTHQGAAFDWNGILQDGQHRFHAIVITNTPVTMQVSVGMDPKNFGKVDTPLLRRAVDSAWLAGEKNVLTLTASARLIYLFDKYGHDLHVHGSERVSIDTNNRVREQCGDALREAVSRARRIRTELAINPTGLAAAIYLITKRLPEGDPRVEKFFTDLEDGLQKLIPGTSKTDPVWMLRRRFVKEGGSKRGPDQYETLAIIIKAWNFRAAGRSPANLIVWRRLTEAFPATIILPPPDRAMGVPDFEERQASTQDGEAA